MTGLRRALAVAVLAGLCSGTSVLVAGPAAAADAGSVSNIKYSDGTLSFSFIAKSGDGLGEAVDLRTAGAGLTLAPLPAGKAITLKPVLTPATRPPTYMLVLDISGSMQGPDFTQETTKALEFLDTVDPRAKVGLTVFGSPAETIVSPTPDHAAVEQAIRGLTASRANRTDLFTAVTKAAKEFPEDDSLSFMVMVTDGNDSLPASTEQKRLGEARKALTRNGIQFGGLIIGAPSAGSDLEKVVAGNSAGRVVEALTDTGGGLDDLFASSASAAAKAVYFTATVPPSVTFTGTVNVQATALDTAGNPVSGSTLTVLLSRPQGAPTGGTTTAHMAGTVSQGSPITTPVLIGALGALFLAMVVLIASATGAVAGGESRESEVTRRLAFYTLGGNRLKPTVVKEEPASTLTESRIARSAINLVNRIARQRKLDNALDARLEAAGLPIRTAEWTLLHLGSAVGGAILGLLLGLALPWMFLSFRTTFRERKFLAQLPDTLQLLSGSLAAGYSLPQAMDAVLRESQAPISVEFNRALIETRLGMPPEDALEGIATRTGSKDFSWVVMAIRIQRDVGGNLAELLSTVADTLRERERLRRQVRALSAEGRLSGIILGALPLLFALFLIFTKPQYIAPLFEQRMGIALLILGTVLLLAGSFWMSRLVKVEV